MTGRFRLFIIVCLASLVLSSIPEASSAYVLPDPDARSGGLGGAVTALAEGPAAVFFNAASLPCLSGYHLQTMKLSLPGSDSFSSCGYAQRVGSVGIGVLERRLALRGLEERDSNGVLRKVFNEDIIDQAIAAGMYLNDNLSLGATYHLWRRNLGGDRVRAHSFDVSGRWDIQNNLQLALVLGGLVSRRSGSSALAAPAPAKFTRIGVGWGVGTSLLAADFEQYQRRKWRLKFGFEIPYRNMLRFRIGHREDNWTMGVGLTVGKTVFDLSVQDNLPGAKTYFSTNWSFERLTLLHTLARRLKGKSRLPEETSELPAAPGPRSALPAPGHREDTSKQLLSRAKLAFLSGDLFLAEQLCLQIIARENDDFPPGARILMDQIEQIKLVNNVKTLVPTTRP